MTPQERKALCLEFLKGKGFEASLDEDGDIKFLYEDHEFFLDLDEEDELFFHLIYPAFWSVENDDEWAEVCDAALQATASTKVAKIIVVDDQVHAAAEMFCPTHEVFEAIFDRAFGAIHAAVNLFLDCIEGVEEQSDEAEEGEEN